MSTNKWIIHLPTEFANKGKSATGQFKLTASVEDKYADNVMINGERISGIPQEGKNIGKNGIVIVDVDETCVPSCNISINVTDSQSESISISKKYSSETINVGGKDIKECEKFTNDEESHAILRTNPKLTGNIKVVVTDKSMYIDTFKVRESLCDFKYSRVRINENDYYGTQLLSIFSNISSSELYANEKSCNDLFSPVSDFNRQFYTEYNFGARVNPDKRYSENFSILAPIRLRKILPDFFIVLKVDGDAANEMKDDRERILHFIENSKIVKTFDMREGSSLGNYIRKTIDMSSKCDGYGYISYDGTTPNIFSGISIDSGTVVKKYEAQTKTDGINNQAAFNDFITGGFERNRIVAKDIINFEYMFDDESAEEFSASTYFGLYIKLNGEDENFYCIDYDTENGKYIFNKEIHTFNYEDVPNFKDMIYGISTPDEFIRLDECLDTSNVNEQFMLKPNKSKYISKATKIYAEENINFMSVSIDKVLKKGTHLRISFGKNEIYDVIISGDRRCYDNGTIMQKNTKRQFKDADGFIIKINEISVPFDTNDTPDSQAEKIRRAFVSIKNNDEYTIYTPYENGIGITSQKEFIFERIFPSNESEDDNSISAFGSKSPEISRISFGTSYDDWAKNRMSYLYPIGFEVLGDRIIQLVASKKVAKGGYMYLCNKKIDDTLIKLSLIYKRINGTYSLYNFTSYNEIVIKDGTEKIRNIKVPYLISYNGMTFIDVNGIELSNGSLTLYENTPINAGLCSILQIKDYVLDVFDANNIISYNVNSKPIGDCGDYAKDIYGFKKVIDGQEEDIRCYFDKSYVPTGYMTDKNDLNKYLKELINTSEGKSSISLLSPCATKWECTGTDSRGMMGRIINPVIIDTSANVYISSTGLNDNAIGFQNDASLDSSYSNPKYVPYSTSTILRDSSKTIYRNFTEGYGGLDDMLYNEECVQRRMSKVSSCGSNGIEVVSCGIKFKISNGISSDINVSDFVGYSAILISTSETYKMSEYPFEIIADTERRQLFLIWHKLMQNNGKMELLRINGTINNCEIRYIDGGIETLVIPNSSKISIQPKEDEKIYISVFTGRDSHNNATDYTELKTKTITGEFYKCDERYIYCTNLSLYSGSELKDSISNIRLHSNTDDRNSVAECIIYSTKNLEGIEYKNELETLRDDIKKTSLKIISDGEIYITTSDISEINVGIDRPVRYERMVYDTESGFYKKFVGNMFIPSAIEPSMRDMLSFNYKVDDTVSGVFKKGFDGCNILINNVNTIPQMWINKTTEEGEYCVTKDYNRLSIDVMNDFSIMKNSMDNTIYRKYYWNLEDERRIIESFVVTSGKSAAIEKKMFLNSRCTCLRDWKSDDTRKVSVTKWKNVKTNASKKTIKIDVTSSLINMIMETDGFKSTWIKKNTYGDGTKKANYILNNIVRFIDINRYTTLDIKRKIGEYGNIDIVDFNDMGNDTKSVTNIRTELKYENEKYFLYIYPNEMGVYGIKMTFSL